MTAVAYDSSFSVPDGFPDILSDFARECLRDQPENIYAYGAQYFAAKAAAVGGQPSLRLNAEELQARMQTLFGAADEGGKGYLSRREATALIQSLSEEFKLSDIDVRAIMAEADANDDGRIQYNEFIPLALEVFESLYAKTELHRSQEKAFHEAEDLLLHGISREQLGVVLHEIFAEADKNGDGSLSAQEMGTLLRDSGIGFTRRELNALLHTLDVDHNGAIDYREFVPMALQVCTEVLAREITIGNMPARESEALEFLNDLFTGHDSEATGVMSPETIMQLLVQADLGLSHVQINAMLSEAAVDDNGMVQYETFAMVAANMLVKIIDFRNAENSASAEAVQKK